MFLPHHTDEWCIAGLYDISFLLCFKLNFTPVNISVYFILQLLLDDYQLPVIFLINQICFYKFIVMCYLVIRKVNRPCSTFDYKNNTVANYYGLTLIFVRV